MSRAVEPTAAHRVVSRQPLSAAYSERARWAGEDDASVLLEYGTVLWRRRWVILAVSLATAAVSLAVSLSLRPLYSGEAVLQIEDANRNFLDLESLSPAAPASSPTDVYLPTQVRILESDSLLALVVDRLRLTDRGEFQGEGALRRWARTLDADSAPPLPPEEIALRRARKRLNVERIVQTQLVAVSFESEDPQLAAALPNELAEAFIRKNLELRREAGRSTSEWLERELHEQKTLLEESENHLQSYARRHGLFFTGQAQESIAEDRMRQVQSELLRAEAAAAAAQARFEAAVSNPPETLGEVLSDESLREKETGLTTLRQELAQAELWFKPNYPQVRELRARIGEMETSLGRERANIVQRIENDYRAARRQADLLGLELERQSEAVSGESAAAVQYNILKREVETNRQVYDSLLQRMKDAGVAAAIQNSNITVVDPGARSGRAFAAQHPSQPRLGLAVRIVRGDRVGAGARPRELDPAPPRRCRKAAGAGRAGRDSLVCAAEASASTGSGRQPRTAKSTRVMFRTWCVGGASGPRWPKRSRPR